MSGDETVGAYLTRGGEEPIEFHVTVAERTRNRSAALNVIRNEWLDYILLEAVFKIDDVVRELEMFRDALRVVNIINRAAAMAAMTIAREFGKAALIPELHGETDDVFTARTQDCGDGGAIHSAAHGDRSETRICFGANSF